METKDFSACGRKLSCASGFQFRGAAKQFSRLHGRDSAGREIRREMEERETRRFTAVEDKKFVGINSQRKACQYRRMGLPNNCSLTCCAGE